MAFDKLVWAIGIAQRGMYAQDGVKRLAFGDRSMG